MLPKASRGLELRRIVPGMINNSVKELIINDDVVGEYYDIVLL
jgi:hypothetical protein